MFIVKWLSVGIIVAPLLGALIAGLWGKRIGPRAAHRITVSLMLVAFVTTVGLAKLVFVDRLHFNGALYTWAISGSIHFSMGLLIDPLTVVMLLVVTLVSLLVHIYSIGYMQGDKDYAKFFGYMSFFTFAMLLLVTANNFLQLFFGWEGVGLASYLLIGFWFDRRSAAEGSLKAFLVNRVGDVGLVLAIAALLDYTGALDYHTVFSQAHQLQHTSITLLGGHCSVLTVICILLFIGAMGKSAQMPLHVWLPESMAGPTPISALIHAATMVTAGVFMVARLSPLFELSPTALSMILIIGATGGLFLGLLAFVEYDIKRIIAYSTLSQLGYMMAANGASAYTAGIFHLVTHAGFKALLFLAAGSVIIALHHEQDLRRMGNLKKYLPITYVCFLIGSLALAAIPPFSGFYSKDVIIDAVSHAQLWGAHYAYMCLLLGTFVTSYYIFRAFFMIFHGHDRTAPELHGKIHETAWTLYVPIVILAALSIASGFLLAKPFLSQQLLADSITVLPMHNVLTTFPLPIYGVWHSIINGLKAKSVWLSIIGLLLAWLTTLVLPQLNRRLKHALPGLHNLLRIQYGFDRINDLILVRGIRALSAFFYRRIDTKWIDQYMVQGSGRSINRLANLLRLLQSGYLYHYVFVMILAIIVGLLFLFLR